MALLFAVFVLLALPAPALASQNQETVLQDDPKIVFPDSTASLDRTLGILSDIHEHSDAHCDPTLIPIDKAPGLPGAFLRFETGDPDRIRTDGLHRDRVAC